MTSTNWGRAVDRIGDNWAECVVLLTIFFRFNASEKFAGPQT